MFLAVVMAGAACAAVPSTCFLPEALRSPLILTGCSVALATLLALWATRAGARSAVWFLAAGPVAGCINSGLSFALIEAANGREDIPSNFLAAALLGSVFAVPLGLLWGGAMYSAWATVRHIVPHAHDAPDRVAVRLGAWLAAVGGCGALALREPWPLAATATGAAMILSGVARLQMRARWLQMVREGKLDSWLIQERLEAPEVPLRPIESSRPLPDGILVWHRPSPGGPYRQGGAEPRLALVHRLDAELEQGRQRA